MDRHNVSGNLSAMLASRAITRRQLLKGASAVGLGAAITPAATAAQDEGSLSLLLGSHMDPIMRLLDLYTEQYGVEPTVEQITTPDLQNRLTSAFLARRSPWDSVFVTAALVSSVADQGWLTPLDTFIDEQVRNGGQGELLERGMGAAMHEGQIYGMPWGMGCPILHWNKQMMEDADLDPEAPTEWHATPNSWDTFVEYATQMTRTDNGEEVYGYTDAWAGDHILWTWGGLLQMHGGRFLDDDLQPVMNSEAGIAATEKLYELLHTHRCVDPAVTTYTWVFDASPGFFNGTRGMFITWPFIAGVASDPEASEIAGHNGFAPNPAVETSASVDGSEFFAIPAFVEDDEAAYQFLELLASREAQRIIAEGGWAGIYGDVMEEPDIIEQFPFYSAIRQSYEYPVDGGWSPDRAVWEDILANELHEVLGQRKEPQEALDDAVNRIIESRN